MNGDPASLDNLRDIVQPPPVSWWPLAPGWWIVIGIAAVLFAFVAMRTWRAWQANAYRRAALKELETVTSVPQVAELLKRTALCAYPRADVASLTGNAWCQWLHDTSDLEVPASVQETLVEGVYSDSTEASVVQVAEFARSWVRQHPGQSVHQSTGHQST